MSRRRRSREDFRKGLLLASLALAFLCPAVLQGQPNPPKPVDGFVWSEAAGWIDMAPEHGGVFVYRDHLAGFAWSESFGWIKLGSDGGGPYANTGPEDWGVNRAPTGELSGFAWSEAIGWIRFDPAFGGVRIDRTFGDFEGFAWSESAGWISVQGTNPNYGASIDLAAVEIPALGDLGLALLALLLLTAGLAFLRRESLRTGV